VKRSFDKEGISFPFPQTDVHIHKVPTNWFFNKVKQQMES
jgi:small-conductance mechanosensitive channel